MWDDLFAKARNDGFNMVQTYWFWNAHQHYEGDWSFEFNTDLRLYVQKAAEHGLFVNFRIGPYVCAEWNYGGFPLWINNYSNLTTRSSSPAWQGLMSQAVGRIIGQVRDLFADRGGPIALWQIENEYASWACDGAIGACDMSYVQWCGELAASFGLGLPVEMCNGNSANTTGVINTCNGNDCASFIETGGGNGRVLVDQPAAWTENEEWFQRWGQPYPDYTPLLPDSPPSRTATGIAYSVARWFARGGSHHNYYMWHGGNHYGRMAGSSVANWYANGGNLNSDGLANEPYRTHLQTLHWVIQGLAPVLLGSPAQVWNRTYLERFNTTSGQWVPGDNTTVAFVYDNGAGTAAFLENSGKVPYLLRFPGSSNGGATYYLPNVSMVILNTTAGNGAGALLFNTSAMAPSTVQRTYTPIPDQPLAWSSWQDNVLPTGLPTDAAAGQARTTGPAGTAVVPSSSRGLQSSNSSRVGSVTTAPYPLEQLGLTLDDSEYLLYTRVITAQELRGIVKGMRDSRGQGSDPASLSSVPLYIESQLAQAFVVFLDGAYAGDAYDARHSFGTNATTGKFDGSANFTVSLNLTACYDIERDEPASSAGVTLSIVSESLGIDNGHGAWVVNGQPYSRKGLFSTVNVGGVSIVTGGTWTMAVGLGGEALQVYTAAGSSNPAVTWTAVDPTTNPPGTALTWYRAFFTTPSSLVDSLRARPGVRGGNMTARGPGSLPEVTSSLLLDLGPVQPSLGRGHFYLNGFDLGRYWSILGIGTDTIGQQYYMLPPDLLVPDVPGGNTLTLVDVLPGTSVDQVQIVQSQLVPVQGE